MINEPQQRSGVPTLPDARSDDRVFRERTVAALKDLYNRVNLIRVQSETANGRGAR
jgi:hypothetical protein